MKSVKNPIKVNFANATIVISKSFSVKASITTSKEYRDLTDVQASYPNYKIVVREIKRNSSKETYPHLTYAYMEHYIATHPNAELRMAEYRECRLRAECHAMRYGHVKSWFLSAYPQIDDFTPQQYFEEQNTIKTGLPLVA
jgi:hypothetical protein